MQKSEILDYDTVYNGRGVEIAEKIMKYFENNIKKLEKEAIIPDRPERDNIVGVMYRFELYNSYIITCGIQNGTDLMVESILDEKVYISEARYMTWEKIKELGFSTNDEIVNEKLDIFNNVIQALRNGKEIVKVDVEN